MHVPAGAEMDFMTCMKLLYDMYPIVQVLRWGAIEDLQSSYRKTLINSLRAYSRGSPCERLNM